ncbi:T9SS type A sorting domain-containing protein [candidate division KSB1 bacterium]|nr:T9SS type A sorting domain-containing protein [candidate division KSB1 bacterium]
MKNLITMLTIIMVILLSRSVLTAGTLQEDRKYEPAVFTAQEVKGFIDVPVNEIFAYAYNSPAGTWSMIPFQIDERTFGTDPLSGSGEKKWYYFDEVWANIDSLKHLKHNGIFDDHDELVFMIKDMGDKAPDNCWIDDEAAKKNDRLEIILSDPNDSDKKAYIYLYRSSTLKKEDVPKPYNMSYNAGTSTVSSAYYNFTFSSPGLVEGITIKTPGGSGEDILDRLKARIKGVINTFLVLPITLNEEVLVSAGLYYTQEPVVRIIRSTSFNFEIAGIVEVANFFKVDTKFYPFSGTIAGGDTLTPDALEKHMGEGVELKLTDLRFSWDLNQKSSGMKMFTKHNDNIPVDGNQDQIDKKVDIPADPSQKINVWSMATGNQGTLFTYGEFANTKWDSIFLYYFDNKNGGTADKHIFDINDTGDKVSYSDNGVLFKASVSDTIVFELDYNIYMMPEKDKSKSFAENLAYNLANPVKIGSNIITDVEGENNTVAPLIFALAQNYPNPFNNSTQFSFVLPRAENISFKIYDTNGRLVKNLTQGFYTSGIHKFHWNGTDELGKEVPSGIYFYQLQAGAQSLHKKLILVR